MNRGSITSKIEDIYDYINNEEDARVCKDISEEACRYTPVNYFLILISNTLTKLGDVLSNPKTVLAWLMGYVNAPLFLISFIVPIRESGAMLPQIVIASYIRRQPLRKWIWVIGSVLQFLSITCIGIVALSFEGVTAGWFIVMFLMLFSLSRGLSSVASKDVMGKTIPRTRRGRLNGYTASLSGGLVLVAGLFMIIQSNEQSGITFYAYIIFFAALLWLMAAAVYANIKEYPGETSGGGNALTEAWKRLDLLKNDKPFRNFVIARALLLCSALTAPFYVVLAQNYLGSQMYILGMVIVANGVASMISAPFWGKWADASGNGVMVKGGLMASLLGIGMFIIVTWVPVFRDTGWLYPLAIFILGIAHSGVRLGRKTYIVDMAGGNKRTDYVAVSNTVIGLVLLITGGISALAAMVSTEGIILVLSLIGIAGAIISARLPDVEKDG